MDRTATLSSTHLRLHAAAVAITAACALSVLGPVAPASAASSLMDCRQVGFALNTDDVAAGIRVTKGTTCALARRFIRDFDAARTRRFQGFTCSWRVDDTGPGLANTRHRCTRGDVLIFWKRY